MGKRLYNFELPYVMDSIHVFYGVGILESEGVFKKLPKRIQTRMLKAKENMASLKVSEADLDKIDDETWGKIAEHLGLKWQLKDVDA